MYIVQYNGLRRLFHSPTTLISPLSLCVLCPDNDDGGGDDCNDGLALAQNVEIVFVPTLRY